VHRAGIAADAWWRPAAEHEDRLAWLAAQLLQPKKRQKPCDNGLFDTESRKQLELF
jgi:hypothetical protein